MKFPVKTTVALAILGVGGGIAYPRVRAWWKARHKPHYRQAEIARGDISSVVNSTGTVQPVLRVQVGTFVSGPIEKLLAYHTDEVSKDQLLAVIDPTIYEASVARDKAILATREAEVERIKALLQQAENEEQRAKDLQALNPEYISAAEMDQVVANLETVKAELKVANAAVQQAEASLKNSMANLGYTEIRSPVDGIIIDCKIEKGQTVAAQFQTPELFVVAPGLWENVHVFASVDEADIGLIRKARDQKQTVHFTVDAYPDDLFEGTIYQIRMNPTTVQNVVTYPVVVEAPNSQEKLLPGMTANLSFQIDKHENVLKVPNAALRFYPKVEQVRPEDRKLLEGAVEEEPEQDESEFMDQQRPAPERAAANRQRRRRHVWIVEGDFLRAVEVATGLNDWKWTELVAGKLKEGQKLVTGVGAPGA